MALVVGYCFLGGFVFERLERRHEWEVKEGISAMRAEVADDIWRMTEEADYLKEEEWTGKVAERMRRFEMDLITAMKYADDVVVCTSPVSTVLRYVHDQTYPSLRCVMTRVVAGSTLLHNHDRLIWNL